MMGDSEPYTGGAISFGSGEGTKNIKWSNSNVHCKQWYKGCKW